MELKKSRALNYLFFQKVKLLPDAASQLAFVTPGILELNTIRNRLGHDLDEEIEAHGLIKINQVLEIAREGIKFEGVSDTIEAFTTVACTFLIVSPTELPDAFHDAFAEIKVNVS